MRKIGAALEDERKRKRNVQIFGIFLLAIMLMSSIGYAFFSNPNVGTVGQDSEFTGLRQVGDKWVFGSSSRPIALTYAPEDVANVTVYDVRGIDTFVSVPLSIDSTDSAIAMELAGVFQYYSSRLQEACYGNCERDLPEKDCSENIIVWRASEEQIVYQNQSCVFIEGDMQAVDAYIYELFGMLPS